MKNILVALMAFILIRLYYSIFVIRKKMKYDPNKASTEVKFLIQKFKLDMKKINYYNFMKTIALINALDIALILFWVSFIDKLNIECLVAVVLMIPVILISYTIFGNYLVKKGLVIDERVKNNKRNRK
ncbi:MAG: hypothetical protein ACI4OT_06160 [Bacilli bacterium]